MEFWGVEVKAGESLKVKPELFKLIHISQAAIGEVKDAKEAKYVPLRLTVGENSFVIGTLSAEDRPQLMFDLVFEKEFELSHGWKNGSVYFIGYTAEDPSTDDIDSGDEDFSDEENVLKALNEKVEADVKDVKPDTKKSAPVKIEEKAKVAEPQKEAESDDDSEDDSDDDEDDSEDDSDDGPVGLDSDGPGGMDMSDDSEDDDDSEEDDDDSEDETPKKVEQKKRPAPSPKVAPGSGKKAKQATPENKSGGKPFAKQNGKPAAANGNNNKQKTQSPKSGGKFSGNKSNKNFSGQKNFKGGKQGRK